MRSRALRRGAAVAVPSRWPDTAPLVIGEGWSAGTPVVGSDLGGISELLADERGSCVDRATTRRARERSASCSTTPAAAACRVDSARAYARAELSRDRWLERMRDVYRTVGAVL